MKIFVLNSDLLGKKVYKDKHILSLIDRFKPVKETFYSVEFVDRNRDACEAVIIEKDKLLDFIIEDIERLEALSGRIDPSLWSKAMKILEGNEALSRGISPEENDVLKPFNLVTTKPFVFYDPSREITDFFPDIFEAAGSVFFFTAGRKEVKAYNVKKETDIVKCASKIHTDIAKGFIRAEVYNVRDLANFHNIGEAKQKGYLKVVGKDYIISDGDVLSVNFSV